MRGVRSIGKRAGPRVSTAVRDAFLGALALALFGIFVQETWRVTEAAVAEASATGVVVSRTTHITC